MKKIPKHLAAHFDQFIVDRDGNMLAVITDAESLDNFIETIRTLFNQKLKEAGVDPAKYPSLETLKTIIFKED